MKVLEFINVRSLLRSSLVIACSNSNLVTKICESLLLMCLSLKLSFGRTFVVYVTPVGFRSPWFVSDTRWGLSWLSWGEGMRECGQDERLISLGRDFPASDKQEELKLRNSKGLIFLPRLLWWLSCSELSRIFPNLCSFLLNNEKRLSVCFFSSLVSFDSLKDFVCFMLFVVCSERRSLAISDIVWLRGLMELPHTFAAGFKESWCLRMDFAFTLLFRNGSFTSIKSVEVILSGMTMTSLQSLSCWDYLCCSS